MSDLQNAKKYAVRRKRHSIWRNVVTCIAAVVVFCTTYALILPAITMEFSCGKEEHVHADGCYTLTCGLQQTPGHFHDESCYDEEGKLICEQIEPQSHTHSQKCYAPECGLEETTGHTHDAASCYALPKILTCGQQEAAAHTHSDACRTQQTSLTCGLEEGGEHIHSDQCYTTSLVFTCTLAETEGHTHADACYTLGDTPELICALEEVAGHTHTEECYPADAQSELICGLEELTVHKHTEECYTLSCVLEEHTHTNECQVKKDGIATEEAVPEKAALVQMNPTPRTAESFEGYIDKNSQKAETGYNAIEQNYTTNVSFKYTITKEQLQKTGGQFFIDLKNDVIVNYEDTYDINSKIGGSDQKTGEFHFITVGEGDQAHPRMVINFDLNSFAGAADDRNMTGEMHFNGIVDKTHVDNAGNLDFDLTDDLHIRVDTGNIAQDDRVKNQYDVSVAKSVNQGEITYPDISTGALGKVPLEYTVVVSSEKGTPDNISLNDQLTWSGNPQSCTRTDLTVVKVVNGAETPVTINQPAQGTSWDMTLDKLEPGESYKITYGYEYTFAENATDPVKQIDNTAKADSRVPGGRPEEYVHGEDKETVPEITPPSPDPSLGKSGKVSADGQTVEWTVTYNEEGKSFGGAGNPNLVITDTMLSGAGNIKVKVGGGEVASTSNGNQLTIPTPNTSHDKIVITYTTPVGALNNWSSGGQPNVVENKASYQGHLPTPVETTATVTKEGGSVSKSAGTVVDDGEKLIIPWTVTITPGADGIPAGKVFTDTVEGNPKPSFEDVSFTVSYADENGNILEPFAGYSAPSYAPGEWNQNKVSFTFNENPFASGKAPDGAKKIVVTYNTTTQDNKENTYKNTTDVDGKKAEDQVYYKPGWVEPHKTHGDIVVGETGLTIPWTVQYKTDVKVLTELTDDLAIAGGGEHYYDPSTVELVIQKNDGSAAQIIPSDAYTLTFSGGTDGKPTSLRYEFKEPGYSLPDNLQHIQLTYSTKTDAVPDVHTDYKNTAKAFNREVSDTAPYDPPGTDVVKTHGEHTADLNAEPKTLTIPWQVKIDIHDGKINTPITDSLRAADNGKNHYFLESAPVLKVLKDDGTEAATISPDDYTVAYYSDYTGSPETGTGDAGEAGNNTYMVITFKETPYLISAEGYKTLRLEYSSVGPLPDGSAAFRNQVWVNGKRAEDTDNFEPIKPKPSKSVGTIRQDGSGVRIPWTVRIELGQLPLTQIDEVAYFNKDYLPEAARHYFDSSTIELKFLDASGTVLETADPIAYTGEFYKGRANSTWVDGVEMYAPDETQTGEPAMFMRLNFTDDGGAFAKAPKGTKYLQLTYETYNENVTAEQSATFKNFVQVSDQKAGAQTSITKVEKKVEQTKDNWVSEQVDAGENTDGALHRWQVRAITSADRSFLTITDVLPQYVTLEGLLIGAGSNMNDMQDWYDFGTVGSTFSANTSKYSVSGTYSTNEDGRYVVEVEFRKADGSNILAGECFDLYLTPKVDVDSLPESLRAKQITLDNQAYVTHDGGGAPSNVSSQTWTDGRDDVAKDSLKKNKYVDRGGKMNYSVEINQKGKDLEPEGNSFVLIDTLSYNSKDFTVITKPAKGDCTGFDIRLDTSDANRLKVFKAKVDKEGKAILDDEGNMIAGEELPSSQWSMTLDTQENGDKVSKIIRLTVPDRVPLILSYTYIVVPRMDPANTSTSLLAFDFNANNTVMMYGHRGVQHSSNAIPARWRATAGGGTIGMGINSFVLKKVDASNNALMLSGAQFTVSERQSDGSWKPVTTLTTNASGIVEINNSEMGNDWRKHNTLYKIVETAPPSGYAMPDSPEEFRFYFSSPTCTCDASTTCTTCTPGTTGTTGTACAACSNRCTECVECTSCAERAVCPPSPSSPMRTKCTACTVPPLSDDLKNGATDLSKVSNVAWVENTSVQASFKVEKTWADSSGKQISGSQDVKFDLIQYRSTSKPSSEVTNPMVSMRNVELTVTGHSVEKKVSLQTTKGSMLKLTVTNSNPNGYWANDLTFSPEIPGLRRVAVETGPNPWNASETVVISVCYEFPVYNVAQSIIGFNASANDLQVTLEPVGGTNTGGGVSGAVEATGKSWEITLKPGEGYNWRSADFDIDSEQDGKQPLPFTEEIDGTTYYYTYLVKEKNSTDAYNVTYSNVDGDGNLVGVSSGTIRVVNTRLENPPISLPNTGGIGTTVLTLAGLALTSGAGIGLCKTSRSKAKRKRGKFEKE